MKITDLKKSSTYYFLSLTFNSAVYAVKIRNVEKIRRDDGSLWYYYITFRASTAIGHNVVEYIDGARSVLADELKTYKTFNNENKFVLKTGKFEYFSTNKISLVKLINDHHYKSLTSIGNLDNYFLKKRSELLKTLKMLRNI